MKLSFKGIGLEISAEEVRQIVRDFRPESVEEWSERLAKYPETALWPLGIFPQPYIIHKALSSKK